MNQDSMAEVERLFNAAMERSPEERAVFLDEQCGENQVLRAHVEAFLEHESKVSPSFLRTPVGNIAMGAYALAGDKHPAPQQPKEIGPFRILNQIAVGGFGIVYKAEQASPIRREVALKLIKPGMDSHAVIGRFEAERQALAMLDHPCVAKVFDAGTTSAEQGSRPYFVMELVDGSPITEFCDQNQLGIDERLRLVCQVCDGLQHAHQKGIIHRDIKPSNVLVGWHNEGAWPKIIDFGVAKAIGLHLTDATIVTEHGQLIGTPEYMSPEQASLGQIDVDTRSDVYSMGVMLYELLTGSLPFDTHALRDAGLVEAQRIIQHEQATKPSTKIRSLLTQHRDRSVASARARGAEPSGLVRQVRGDLDWIVMKALEKDRSRRYTSIAELAADIRRHQESEPVVAGPPSVRYRANRFMMRHKAGVVAAALVFIVVMAGLVATTWQAVRATRAETLADDRLQDVTAARDEAEHQAEIAEAVITFITQDLLSAANPYAAEANSPNITVKEALGAASETVGLRFKSEPLVEAAIRNTIGSMHWHLGDGAGAVPHLERAFALREQTLGFSHADTRDSLNFLALVYEDTQQFDNAEALHKRALEFERRVLGNQHESTLATINNLGALYLVQGRLEEAEELCREVLQARMAMHGDDHPETLTAMNNLGNVLRRQQEPDEAERYLVATLEGRRRVLGNGHAETLKAMNNLATLYHDQERFDEAEALFAESLTSKRELLGAGHTSTLISAANLADLYRKTDRFEEGRALLERTIADGRGPLGDDHWLIGVFKIRLGACLTGLERFSEAENTIQAAHDLLSETSGVSPAHLEACATAFLDLYEAWNKPEQAAEWRARVTSH